MTMELKETIASLFSSMKGGECLPASLRKVRRFRLANSGKPAASLVRQGPATTSISGLVMVMQRGLCERWESRYLVLDSHGVLKLYKHYPATVHAEKSPLQMIQPEDIVAIGPSLPRQEETSTTAEWQVTTTRLRFLIRAHPDCLAGITVANWVDGVQKFGLRTSLDAHLRRFQSWSGELVLSVRSSQTENFTALVHIVPLFLARFLVSSGVIRSIIPNPAKKLSPVAALILCEDRDGLNESKQLLLDRKLLLCKSRATEFCRPFSLLWLFSTEPDTQFQPVYLPGEADSFLVNNVVICSTSKLWSVVLPKVEDAKAVANALQTISRADTAFTNKEAGL